MGAATPPLDHLRVIDQHLGIRQADPAQELNQGHSTITMTLDTYAHVMGTTLRAAADQMDDALGDAPSARSCSRMP
ncbi:hypothetical protein ACFW9O_08110 [Streptomyces sp. NPDC059499]|uniref:hypothetical protein n=1 Tax=Streptomyces sp. NPDC059499 TaxID=3346852 RepID=UPI003699129C